MVGCQDYDDQFAELTGLVNGLSTEVAGLSTVNASVAALNTTVNGLSSAIAAIPTTDSTAALTALTTALSAAQADIDAIEALLANVTTADELAAVSAALAAVQEDVTTLLQADAVINQSITISNSANLEYASTLVAHAADDPMVIVNGAVLINTTALTASETITANEIAGKLKTVIGNVTLTAAVSLNVSNLAFINGNYSVSGSDANDGSLVTISGTMGTNYSGPHDYTHLGSVGAVTITNHASATLVDFTGVTVASINGGTMTFASATSVNLGTAPVTSLTANKATTIETRMVTAAGVAITATSATAINVNQMTSSTGNISITGAGTPTIVHFDALATIAGTLTTVTVGEAHFGALTQSTGALAIAAGAAANFGALTDLDDASSIGVATVILTNLAAATGTLTLPNATTANLPAFSAAVTGKLVAPLATSVTAKSSDIDHITAVKATSLTLSAQSVDWVSTDAKRIAQIPLVSALSITGKTVATLSTVDVDITTLATITTVTVGGMINTLDVTGGAITTLTTSGNITDFTVENVTTLTSLSLGHTFISGDTAATITVTNNDKLAAVDMSEVAKVKTIVITGNLILTSIVAPSITTLAESAADITITTGTNSLSGVYTNGVAAIAATETTSGTPAVLPIVANDSVFGLITWFNAQGAVTDVLSDAASDTNINIENIRYSTTAAPTVVLNGLLSLAVAGDSNSSTAGGPITTAAHRSYVAAE